MPDQPVLPEGLIWGLFTHNETGRLHLVNRDGESFSFDRDEVPNLAVALSNECFDNHDRGFVRSEWCDLEDDEDEDPDDA